MLGGGEVAACLVIEAVVRLLPGAMGNDVSPVTESFGADGLLEEPQYTRPAEFRGWAVPECCAAATTPGSSAGAGRRRCTARLRYRPDLVEAAGGLREADRRLLEEFPPVPYP